MEHPEDYAELRKDFYNNQFGALRQEILFHLGQAGRSETSAPVAAAGVWAWLASQHLSAALAWCWFIPVLFPVFGVIRARSTGRKVQLIGAYLRYFEHATTADRICGWETATKAWLDSKIAGSRRQRRGDEWYSELGHSWHTGLDRTAWLYWSTLLVITAAIGLCGYISAVK